MKAKASRKVVVVGLAAAAILFVTSLTEFIIAVNMHDPAGGANIGGGIAFLSVLEAGAAGALSDSRRGSRCPASPGHVQPEERPFS